MTIILVKFPNAAQIDQEEIEKDKELDLKIIEKVKGIIYYYYLIEIKM
jgi:hypothetical protein